ncbi:hypothetical protein GWK47_046088 [Chionoecetes opilio]|uniref:Uncharacterized protein n=1 Tax=Chionoecetes opilio TaxID=41210 RepID=A0A8J4YCE0_CHIOP|nr:hypothetical protein GWK47_046088 [Chionoecetes opilio]
MWEQEQSPYKHTQHKSNPNGQPDSRVPAAQPARAPETKKTRQGGHSGGGAAGLSSSVAFSLVFGSGGGWRRCAPPGGVNLTGCIRGISGPGWDARCCRRRCWRAGGKSILPQQFGPSVVPLPTTTPHLPLPPTTTPHTSTTPLGRCSPTCTEKKWSHDVHSGVLEVVEPFPGKLDHGARLPLEVTHILTSLAMLRPTCGINVKV